MSHRYPDEMRCPDCNLLVKGSKHRGELRAHARKAIDAGRADAACAAPRPGSKRAEIEEARQHQRAAAPQRRAYWESRDRATRITAEGTAQPR